ncbi:MAG: DNA gyrase inhibitor YacG [Pseudomonadota bacterium]
MTSSNNNETGASTRASLAPCPICQAPQLKQYAPFCSKRCADVDLHRWLSGGYAIPVIEEDGAAEAEGLGQRAVD